MTPFVVVLVTVGSAKEGKKIAEALVRERLAACVNLVPGITSHYRWKGKTETSRESLLMIKTRRSKFAALRKRVRGIHSYETPEIIASPILEGDRGYLRWLSDSLKS